MDAKIYSNTLGKGQDLVMLPGWGMHSGLWQNFAAKLAEHFRVTLIDLPGFGQSRETLDPYNLETLVANLLEIAPAQAAWLGWSLGGLVAMQTALRAPERVTKLITLSATPKFVAEIHWPGQELIVLQQMRLGLAKDPKRTFNDFLLMESKDFLRDYSEELFKYGEPDPKALLAGVDILRETDLRSELKNINCPNLHLFGEQDKIIPVGVAAEIPRLNAKAQVKILAEAAHTPFLSHEGECVAEIVALILCHSREGAEGSTHK